MGARAVRQAIRDFISTVDGISNAYRDEPHYVSNEAWYTEDGTHGTVAYVHLDQESETRLTITGFPDAGQQITYTVGIVVLYEYLISDDETSPDNWVEGLDDVLDALKARLRSDPSMGSTNLIWNGAQQADSLAIS